MPQKMQGGTICHIYFCISFSHISGVEINYCCLFCILPTFRSSENQPIIIYDSQALLTHKMQTEKCGSGIEAGEDIKRKEFVIEYVGEGEVFSVSCLI